MGVKSTAQWYELSLAQLLFPAQCCSMAASSVLWLTSIDFVSIVTFSLTFFLTLVTGSPVPFLAMVADSPI